jgi:ribonuclease Z
MTKGLFFAVSAGCLSLLLEPSVVQAAPPDNLKVVLLGTGGGPAVNLEQFGASTLIEAGSERFLFDCGRGATLRLTGRYTLLRESDPVCTGCGRPCS